MIDYLVFLTPLFSRILFRDSKKINQLEAGDALKKGLIFLSMIPKGSEIYCSARMTLATLWADQGSLDEAENCCLEVVAVGNKESSLEAYSTLAHYFLCAKQFGKAGFYFLKAAEKSDLEVRRGNLLLATSTLLSKKNNQFTLRKESDEGLLYTDCEILMSDEKNLFELLKKLKLV